MERYEATAKAHPSGDEFSRSVHRKVYAKGEIRYSGWSVQLTSEWAGVTVEVIETGGKVRVVYGDELITSFSTEQPKGYIGTGVGRGRHRIPRRIDVP